MKPTSVCILKNDTSTSLKNNHKSSQWHHIHCSVLKLMLSNARSINHRGQFHRSLPAVPFCLLLPQPWWWGTEDTHTHTQTPSSAFPRLSHPSLFGPELLSSPSSEYKVNPMLQLGLSQSRKAFTTQTLTTIYKILHLYRIFIENTLLLLLCCSFSGMQDYRLSRPLDIQYTDRPVSHWPCKACNLAQLFMEQGEHIHPSCSSLLMVPGSCGGRSHLCLSPYFAWWAQHFLCEAQSYYPSMAQ